MRKLAFRLMMLSVLTVSPILFPVLLLWMDRRIHLVDLAEMYGETWTRLRRGYP